MKNFTMNKTPRFMRTGWAPQALMMVIAFLLMTLCYQQTQAADVNTYAALLTEAYKTSGDATIRLTGHITNGADQLTIRRNLTLDLNGYNLTIDLPSSSYVISGSVKIASGVTLTIKDSYPGGNKFIINNPSTVTSGNLGAGINSSDGTVVIESGTIIATAGIGGAGIGGSNEESGGIIKITGGTVIATGGTGAAGIGGGGLGASGNITITGGAVTAIGSEGGSGIGSGYGAFFVRPVNSITITGELVSGSVTPTAGQVKAVGSAASSVTGADIGQGAYVSFWNSSGAGIKSVTSPVNRAVTEGQTATFSVTVTRAQSPAVAYQWQFSTDGGSTWYNVLNGTGDKSNSYTTVATTTGMNGYLYRCHVTVSGLGGSPGTITLSGKPAMLTVNKLTLQSRINAAAVGSETSPITINLLGATETLSSTLQIADISSGGAPRNISLVNGTIKRDNGFTGSSTDLIKVPAGSSLHLEQITIDGGTTSGAFSGTAIYITGGNMTGWNNVTIKNNKTSGAGGGIAINAGVLTLKSNINITGNTASGNGGGIYVSGTNTECNLLGGSVTNNIAGGSGGGVGITGSSTALNLSNDFRITGNQASNGGGINLDNGTFNLYGGVISGNTATTSAPGVLYYGGTLNVYGNPQVGTSSDNNAIRRRYNTTVINVTGSLTSGAFFNIEPLSSDAANTIVATKTSGALTDAETGYFHYQGSNTNLIRSGNNIVLLRLLTSAIATVTAPVKGAPTNNTVTTGTGYSGVVTWIPNDNLFLGGVQYTAEVTLTANSGYRFASTESPATINEKTATVISHTETTVKLSYQFPATGNKSVAGLNIISQPSKLTYSFGEALDLSGLAVILTYDDASTQNVPFVDFGDYGINTAPIDGSVLAVTHNGVTVLVSCGGFSDNTLPITVNPIVITTADLQVVAPMTGQTPGTMATGTGHFFISPVSWNPADNPFLGVTSYEITVLLTAETGYTFDASLAATINAQPATVAGVPGATATLTYQFPATNAASVTGITLKTQPTKRTYAHGEALDLSGLVLTLSFDDATSIDILTSEFWNYGITTNPNNGSVLNELQNGISIIITCGSMMVETSPLTVGAAPVLYYVSVDGSSTASGAGNYHAGVTVTINAGSLTGYTFAGWTTASSGVVFANASAVHTTFVMPAADVVVTAIWTADPVYTITIEPSAHGCIVADRMSALQGETVTLTITSDAGYELAEIWVFSNNVISAVAHVGNSGKDAVVTMPAANITIRAIFHDPVYQDVWETAKKIIEAATFTLTQQEAPNDTAARYRLAELINALLLVETWPATSLQATPATSLQISPNDIVIYYFIPASSGDVNNPSGSNGIVQFRVLPPDTRTSAYSQGIIIAMSFDITSNEHTEWKSAHALKAYIQNGLLYVSGLRKGEPWSIYHLNGMLLYTGIATRETETYPYLPKKEILIITNSQQSIKIISQ